MDHTPPECIFPKPLPKDMITVPACVECNCGNSKEDEEFKAYISISVGLDHPKAKLLWDECLKTLKHNKKLYTKIMRTAKPAIRSDPSSKEIEKGHSIEWSVYEHFNAIKKIVRGLYYNQYEEILSQKVIFNISPLYDISGKLEENIRLMPNVSIGGDQFIFWYTRIPSEPDHSVWIIKFYNAHIVFVETIPENGN